MTHKTLVIDLDRCIGCFACEMACKQENNVPLGVHYNKVLSIGPMGKFPDLTQYFLPTVCQHCKDAPCVKVCPDRRHLPDRGRTGPRQQGEVHRLQDVHGRVPVRRTLLQPRGQGG